MAIDPPYRFDPFQNLVNVHWEATPIIQVGWAFVATLSNYRLSVEYHVVTVAPPTRFYNGGYSTSITWEQQDFSPPAGFVVSGAPTVEDKSWGAWQYEGLQFAPGRIQYFIGNEVDVPLVGLIIDSSLGIGYYGNHIGDLGGIHAGGYCDGNSHECDTVRVSTSLSATKDGAPWEHFKTEVDAAPINYPSLGLPMRLGVLASFRPQS